MSAPEAPLRYVGIDRNSAAFRLMKQMSFLPRQLVSKPLKLTMIKLIKKTEKAKKVEADKQNKASKKNHDPAVKVTRPQGRYKRREKGKLVQAYSSQDLEGILVKKVKSSNTHNDHDVSKETESMKIQVPDIDGNF